MEVNDYLKQMEDRDNAERTRLSASATLAIDSSPEEIARQKRIANLLGTPVAAVQGDPSTARQQATVTTWEKDTLDAPGTREKYTDADFAALAQDQSGPLAKVERFTRNIAAGFGGDFVGSSTAGLGRALNSFERLLTSGESPIYEKTPGQMYREWKEKNQLIGAGDLLVEAGETTKKYFKDIAPKGEQSFSDQVARGLGQLPGQLALFANPYTAPVGIAMMYGQGSDQMYEKISKDKKAQQASQVDQDLEILSGGGITAATEWLSSKLLLKPPQLLALKSKLLGYTAKVALGGAEEGTQELMENIGQDIVHIAMTNPESKIAFGEAFEAGGVGGVVGSIASSVINAALHIKTRRFQQSLTDLSDASKAQQVRERDPETYQGFADAITGHLAGTTDGAVENLYVDANVFAQAMTENKIDPAKAVAAMGIDPQIFDEAKVTGGDLVIPMNDFVGKVAGTEIGDMLNPHLRSAPDAVSIAELAEIAKIAPDLQAKADQIAAKQTERKEWTQSMAEVQRTIADQLIATGIYSPSVSRMQSSLAANMYANIASEMGITPAELYQMKPYKVEMGELSKDQSGITYNQEGNINIDENFKNWFGESKVVDKKGKPRVVYHGTDSVFTEYANGDYFFFAENKKHASGYGKNIVQAYLKADNLFDYADKASIEKMRPWIEQNIDAFNETDEDVTGWTDEDFEDAGIDPLWAGNTVDSMMQSLNDGMAFQFIENVEGFVDELKRLGFDGFTTNEDGRNYAVFSPTQIKSVFNRGTFDPNNPNILNQDLVDKLSQALTENGPNVDSPVALPPSPVLYQLHPESIQEWKDRTTKWMEKNGYSDKEIKKHIKAIDGQLKIFSALGPVQIEMFPKGAGRNKGKGKGAIRTNQDPIYKITFDASAMCVRRLEAGATAAAIEQKIGRALTSSERMALVVLFQQAGKTAPCLYCYVESPRSKMSEFAQAAADIAVGQKAIPKRWSQSMQEKAREAVEEAKGLTFEEGELNVNLVIDPLYQKDNLEAAAALAEKAPKTWEFIQANSLAAKANLPKLYEEYTGQILELPQELIDELNGYAGLRFFSSSDFQAEHVVDLMEAFIDMEMRRIRAHSYTKVVNFAEIFGGTGMKIQTSLFAKTNQNGEIVEDTDQGMGWEDAKRLRLEHKDVGTVFVSTSDEQLQWALSQDWIDYIIPFHYSGMKSEAYQTLGWQDSTSTQSEKAIYKGEKAQKIRMHEIGVAKGMTNEEATRKYLELAMERKLYPVFPSALFNDFAPLTKTGDIKKDKAARAKQNKDARERWKSMVEAGKIDWDQINPNYFKVKKDYARTDSPFNPVQAKFNTDKVMEVVDSFLAGKEPRAVEDPAISEKFMELQKKYGQDMGLEALKAKADNRTFFQSARETLQQAAPTGRRAGFDPSRLTTILTKESDLSSFFHETGHFFLTVYSDLAADPNATPRMQQDMQTILDWFGVKDLAAWNAMTLEEQRPYHEQFAYNYEIYLFEGKAPSIQMQTVFERFSAWLKKVYSSIRDELNQVYKKEHGKDLPILTGEVRDVMDRMLASDKQIREAEAVRGMMPIFRTQEESGMTDEEWIAYQSMSDEAHQAALDQHTQASLRQMKWLEGAKSKVLKGLQAQAKEARAKVKAEVTEEIMQQPVYRAIRFITKGEFETPGDANQATKRAATDLGMGKTQISTEALRQMYGEDANAAWRYLPTNMVSTDGVHPDLIAGLFGYTNGDEMIRSILEATPMKQAIKDLTDQRMLEEHGELTDPKALAIAVDRAIHNEARARFIAVELRHLAKSVRPVRVMQEAARQAARAIIGKKPIGTINPKDYSGAEAKAAVAAETAMKKGDTAAATQAKEHQLLQNMLASESLKANTFVAEQLDGFKKVFSPDKRLSKTRDMNYVNVARSILAHYGIGSATETADSYLSKIRQYDPEFYAEIEPMITAHQEASKFATDLTFDQFQDLADQVQMLWHLSRRVKQIEIDGQLMDRKEVVGMLDSRIRSLIKPGERAGYTKAMTKWDEAKIKLMGVRASLRRVESWVDAMDGGNPTGPFRTFIWNPISEAVTKFRGAQGKYFGRYVEILKEAEITLQGQDIVAEELDYTFKPQELLHAILHTGNSSNKRKLLLGRGWAEFSEDGETLDTSRWDTFINRAVAEGRITKDYYDFAQKVWDLMEEMKPGAQKAHHDMYGYYFNEITAEALETPWGVYAGGYVPAVTDARIVTEGALRNEQETQMADNSFMFPTTGRGFTKGRVEYNRPLLLDLGYLASHIDKVLRFTYIEPRVKDVARIVKTNKAFGETMDELDPTVRNDMLVPWLQRTAMQMVSTPSKGWGGKAADSFFTYLRTNTGLQMMVANVTNTLQQFTGLSISALKVKPALLRNALWQYTRQPGDTAQMVADKSDYMKTRMTAQQYEMRQKMDALLLNPTKYDKVVEFAKEHGYFMQTATQNIVDTITWMGAYNQAVQTGVSEKDAVRQADSAVRQTQGSFAPEDISRFETGSAFVRAFTHFYSYFNMQANILGTEFVKVARELGVKDGAGKMLYIYTFGFMIPAVLSEMIVQAAGGFDAGDDDEYDLWNAMGLFFGSQFRTLSAMVPGVGPAVVAGVNAWNRKPYDDRMSTSPAVSTIEATVSAPHSVYKAIAEDGSWKKATRDTLTALGLITRLPLGQLGKPAGYLMDVQQGKAEPEGVTDVVRGLISGKDVNRKQ